ncbi:MAG: Hsp33 family molecular chaperone HslO [Desulfobacterales bacterium]
MIRNRTESGETTVPARHPAGDRLTIFLLENGSVRGAACTASGMVNEMRSAHGLDILETLVLGHAYMGAALMASNLKSGGDRLVLQIDCSGPIRGLVVEANAAGQVRGYLKQVPILIEKEPRDFDLSPFFGAGFLKVTRYLEDAKQPFTGQVMLEHGNLAQDLAVYYRMSEQTPTALALSIQFDAEGTAVGAGGLLLQVMPGAAEGIADRLEPIIAGLPSIGKFVAAGGRMDHLVRDAFDGLSPKLLEHRSLSFFCPCSRERLRSVIMLLPEKDLLDLKENGPFPVEMRCHNCNAAYAFTASEIEEIYGLRRSDN